jgi:hypothetical protein
VGAMLAAGLAQGYGLAATTAAKTMATIARRIFDNGQLICGVAKESQDRELWMRDPATFEQFALRHAAHLIFYRSICKPSTRLNVF